MKNPHHTPTLLSEKENQELEVDGHILKLTNLNKIFWEKEKYTKSDLINYYYEMAGYILPYLKDRPESLNRHPNGINKKSFFQKDVRDFYGLEYLWQEAKQVSWQKK